MPSGSDTAKKRKMASVSGADHLSALPDALLQHVLSFLPSRDAVQTCVLARRWRDQWKSVPALRITNAESYGNAYYLNKFVNYLLLLRDRSPLHECELKFCHTEDSDEAFRYVELWIRHAMSSQVRVLRICNDVEYELWQAPNMPLSKHLTRLELYRVELEDCFSDVSSCPALEELKLSYCRFLASKISSPSLKHLSIILCDFHGNVRTRISAPSLISLELDDHRGLSPLVERMPSLVSAFVRLGLSCHDQCLNGYEVGGCGDDLCVGCCGSHDEAKGCVLLEGLSEAVNLELIAEPRVFALRKDLKRCPVFSKLKTLLVNEWCMTANFGALLCFLQHSPSIEMLILQFCESPHDMVETGATYDVTEQAFSSKYLTVQVKCDEVDKHVRKMLEVLGTYGIPPEQIEIQQALRPSENFSFEQRKE